MIISDDPKWPSTNRAGNLMYLHRKNLKLDAAAKTTEAKRIRIIKTECPWLKVAQQRLAITLVDCKTEEEFHQRTKHILGQNKYALDKAFESMWEG